MEPESLVTKFIPIYDNSIEVKGQDELVSDMGPRQLNLFLVCPKCDFQLVRTKGEERIVK